MSNMTPRFTLHGETHGGLRDSVVAGELSKTDAILIMEPFAHENDGCRQFRSSVVVAARMFGAVFPLHVKNIVPLRSENEMVRPDAKAVVAGVHDYLFSWMLTGCEVERKTMRQPLLSTETYGAVSARVGGPSPEPTAFGSIHSFVESFAGLFRGETIVGVPSRSHPGRLTVQELGVN